MAEDAASVKRDGSAVEPSVSLESLIKESDEVGYLFLEDGEAKLVSDGAGSIIGRNLPTRTWIDVEWDTSALPSFDAKNLVVDPSGNNDVVENGCARCDLVLHPASAESDTAKLFLKKPPFFNGMLPDMTAHSSTCSSFCKCTENRSDAALLAGVAFTCQFYGYIAIRRIQAMFAENRQNDASKMSLVITFAMPALTIGNQHGRRSIVPSSNVSTRKKTVSKPLPPSAQLLLSILRSDWDFLEKQMEKLKQAPLRNGPAFVFQMQHDGSLTKTKRTLFPQKLSLENLYLRLRGVTTSELDAESRSPSLLASLPPEIIVTSVAPFLRARSVDALRRSCKLFHHTLRAFVPGLKLRLYTHQIRSLEWMRRRETEELSERDVVDVNAKLFGTESVNGDMHRAVTGGATTCLRLRTSAEAFRVDQQTGIEIPHEAGKTLSRQIARGGLLCDDPGLGKTITVMSLILQTSGLSTEPGNEKPKAGTALSHTDEDIFQAYWSEHVPYMYRRGGFMRLLNALRRHSPDARAFEFPVDPVKDCCPDYLDIIDRPICLSEIEESIREDYRFKDFQADVDRCFQ